MGDASPVAALRYQPATAERDRAIAEALSKLAMPAPIVPIRELAHHGRPRRTLQPTAKRLKNPSHRGVL